MSKIEEIQRICAEAAGIDLTRCVEEKRSEIFNEALRFVCFLGGPHPWPRPREVEDEIEGIISDIRSLRRRIQALDPYARSIARREADRPEQEEAIQALIDAEDDPDLRQAALDRLEEHASKPQSEWVDFAALKHLEKLEAALTLPAERAIERADQSGSRRPKNLDAHNLALAAAYAYQSLTGETPGHWNGGSTPFSRMVEELFRVTGINANARKPIEAAIHKLRERD